MRLRAAALLLATGCAPALHGARPVSQLGTPAAADGRSASDLVAEGDAAFARRPDVGEVRRAESLFLAAATADERSVEGLYRAILAKIWLVEHEKDGGARSALAVSAVEAGQSCLQRAPASAACDYALALALGVQARERHSTVTEGLKLMVERLRRAAAEDASIDRAGPERILALVLVRAPQWPMGPGDPETGLSEAKKAVARFPDFPPNQLALAEALMANGSARDGRAAAKRGTELARARVAAGDPDARDWLKDGEKLLAKGAIPDS